jgi:hypothetical protein
MTTILGRGINSDMVREEVTMRFLLNALKQSNGAYGYDLWLPNLTEQGTLLWQCAVEVLRSEPPPPYAPPTAGMGRHMTFGGETRESKTAAEIYPLAADILWLLCRRGILRPGVRNHNGQSVTSGEGYSLTIWGREWVKSHTDAGVQELLAAL